jgi:hypothetical protein
LESYNDADGKAGQSKSVDAGVSLLGRWPINFVIAELVLKKIKPELLNISKVPVFKYPVLIIHAVAIKISAKFAVQSHNVEMRLP